MAPAILKCRNSWAKIPQGGRPSKEGRRGSLLVWAHNDVKRVRTMGNGHKILVNRGPVVLRGDRG